MTINVRFRTVPDSSGKKTKRCRQINVEALGFLFGDLMDGWEGSINETIKIKQTRLRMGREHISKDDGNKHVARCSSSWAIAEVPVTTTRPDPLE